MTPSEIVPLAFDKESVDVWGLLDPRHRDWPVVYVLDQTSASKSGRHPEERLRDIYVGETRNAVARLRQHLANPEKRQLDSIRVIVDETFNKSACLDLESRLIQLLSADGSYSVLNRNDGITAANYYDRNRYRSVFDGVVNRLRADGVFTRPIPEIENSDLFKLSPFKALTQDQAAAVEDILEGLFDDIREGAGGTLVIEGQPGTGKTVVAVYLLKLLMDIVAHPSVEEIDGDSLFSDFFLGDYAEMLAGLRVGMVIPQQSLRDSIKKVFRKTPGLSPSMVMTPFDVGQSDEEWDLLIVDEAHRLNQRANQSTGVLNKKFPEINTRLFGADDLSKTQLDWIVAKSRHQILLVDVAQSVRPADLSNETVEALLRTARSEGRHYGLSTQMRVQAGADFVGYVRRVLRIDGRTPQVDRPSPQQFDGYDLRMFDDLGELHREIRARDAEGGLARLVAGYAWKWVSKKDPSAADIELDGVSLRWNGTTKDWISSKNALEEVGSIHTVQGYDLNYAGVIIGGDLRYDAATGQMFVDRSSYFDVKGVENNKQLGRRYTDAEVRQFVLNIYGVLLTRGIRGTYVYVVDPALRAYLKPFLAPNRAAVGPNAT
ncbi:DNA/RNA helicase domain-containing protein [Frigoribacterium sp. CFBP9030]|uniref:DNA/RNA helicase domain-containing protein n=1 Tax=Frigoribacterium sp. CFBP9030 TaxID=3096537 RepID=UPI002A6B17A2|nr:DNA/RNA helicase domain-containing protein [Frigoribacterium sp. CFBP9030]MDY0890776.1 DNA/RNA helicase domain-containing protein [Frigoribacterium sp. CFBP9030]